MKMRKYFYSTSLQEGFRYPPCDQFGVVEVEHKVVDETTLQELVNAIEKQLVERFKNTEVGVKCLYNFILLS